MSGKTLYALLLGYGCVHIRTTRGSHFIIENPENNRRTAVPIHGNKDIGKGLFAKIICDLGIDMIDFLNYIK